MEGMERWKKRSCRNFRYSLLSQIRDYPNLEGQVPVFKSPRNMVAHLYPQALGSIFVVSYDSQGYGGGIRTRLHTSLCELTSKLCPAYNPSARTNRKHSSFIVACVSVGVPTWSLLSQSIGALAAV
jgi:hypothetical protein